MASQFTFGDSFLNAYIGAQQRAQQKQQYEQEMNFKKQQASERVKEFNTKMGWDRDRAKVADAQHTDLMNANKNQFDTNTRMKLAGMYTTDVSKDYNGTGVDASDIEKQFNLDPSYYDDGVKLYARDDISNWLNKRNIDAQTNRINQAISANQPKPPTAGQVLAGRKQGLQWSNEANTWEPIPEAKLPEEFMDIQLPSKDSFIPTDNMGIVGKTRQETGLSGSDLLEAVQKVQKQNKATNLSQFDNTINKYTEMLDWMEQNPNSPEAQYQFMQYFSPEVNQETGNVDGITATSLLGSTMKNMGYDDKTIENKLRQLKIRIATNPVYQYALKESGYGK